MTQPFVIDLVTSAAQIIGLAGLSGAAAILAALIYRWYTHAAAPEGLAVLTGVGVIAVYLNTTTVLGQVIGGTGHLTIDTAIVNTATFAVAAVAALGGRYVGDRLARELTNLSDVDRIESDVSQIVRAVGRVIQVTIPAKEEIEDIEGYDPVPDATKETLAGKTLVFPRRLTIAELRSRLITRLKEDYGVGHVGIEVTDDGEIEYLALGSRASGIGPTLGPGTAATAIRADPAFAASSGDIVQLWRTDSEPERVATAELRASVGDIVTVALDAEDAKALSSANRYRLATLPAEPRPDREFASLLRAADETMGVLVIPDDSGLIGQHLGDLDITVIGVLPAAGPVEAIPKRDYVLAPGDTVYAIARPEALRRLEATAGVTTAEPSS